MSLSRLIAAATSLALASLAACSSDDPGGHTTPDASPPVNDAGAGDATLPDATTTDAASQPDGAPPDGGDAGDGSTGDAAPDAGSSLVWISEDAGADNVDFYALGGSGPGDVYVSTNRRILHSTGDGTWTQDFDPSGNQYGVRSFATLGPGRMFATVANHKIIYRDPTGTTEWATIGGCTSPDVRSGGQGSPASGGHLAMSGARAYADDVDTACILDDLVGVADGGVANDPGVLQTYSEAQIGAVFTSDSGSAYLAGRDGSGLGFASYASGTTWIPLAVPASMPSVVDGSASGATAWFLTAGALYRSSAFGPLTAAFTFAGGVTLNGVWAAGEDDVWVVGAGSSVGSGLIVHLQGSKATTYVVPGVPYPLTRVWGSGPTDIYAVSLGTGFATGGTLLHAKL